jgi:hypothetical protein
VNLCVLCVKDLKEVSAAAPRGENQKCHRTNRSSGK